MTHAPAVDLRSDPAPDDRIAGEWRPSFPSLEHWLTDGGDTRLDIDPLTGANKYGCRPNPTPTGRDFASSTASTISPRGWTAAQALANRLAETDSRVWRSVTYGREMDRVRAELLTLCDLTDMPGLDVIFAASGTDAHLIVADLVGDATRRPLVCLAIEPEETGSGVPAALNRRHFSTVTALGETVVPGEAVGVGDGGYVAVASRRHDGSLRPSAEVAAELEAIIAKADQAGRRVVLSVTDVSKTGLITPDLDTVVSLCWRYPDMLQVVIDACQFRLSPATLRAYLEHGFIVTVTGSKFLAGPCFSGAVFVPSRPAKRLRARRLSPGLAQYTAPAEWPSDWAAAADLSEAANYGLLLRWEAALAELRAFRSLDPDAINAFTGRFAGAVQTRLAADPAFEPLATRPLDRTAIAAAPSWDSQPTIFPFLMRAGGRLLDRDQTQAVYRRLSADPSGANLGQPVACGAREGVSVSALRLCASARLIDEAVSGGAEAERAVIKRAMDTLEAVASLLDGDRF
jgi:hypothetical protein